MSEIEGERESVCVYVFKREGMFKCVCVCVRLRETDKR